MRITGRVGPVMVLVVAVATAAAGAAESIEVELELVELDRPNQLGVYSWGEDRIGGPELQLLELAGGEGAGAWAEVRRQRQAFQRLVREEPAYHGEPLRAVVTFGGREFPFALDRAQPDGEVFDRLHFDTAGTGELTTTIVADAEAGGAENRWVPSGIVFPQVKVSVPGDESDFRYCFTLQVIAGLDRPRELLYVQRLSEDEDLLRVSGLWGGGYAIRNRAGRSELDPEAAVPVTLLFRAACYRQGRFYLGDEEIHVALLDGNSNGRFSDQASRSEERTGARYHAIRLGDRLVLGPAISTSSGDVVRISGERTVHIGPLLSLGGTVYELYVAPEGDRLTLTPTPRPLGVWTSPHGELRVTLVGEQGVFETVGKGMEPVAVPAGRWSVHSYTIRSRETETMAEAAIGGDGRGRDRDAVALLQAIVPAAVPPLEVAADQMQEFPFGPPLRPVVEARWPQRIEFVRGALDLERVTVADPDDFNLDLYLSFLGAGGERVHDVTLGGSKPPAPRFEVLDPDGRVVVSGVFRYG